MRWKAGFDIIYDSARVLMRGMDFSENYCGAERNVERWKRDGRNEESLNEDLKRDPRPTI